MKWFFAFIIFLNSFISTGQTVDEIFDKLTIRQRMAMLFVVEDKVPEVQGLAPAGHLELTVPKSSLAMGNGISLLDATTGFNDGLSVPFPSGEVVATASLENQRLLFGQLLSMYGTVGGVVCGMLPGAVELVSATGEMPVPERMIVFRDAIGSRKWNVAGLIKLPLELLFVDEPVVPNPLVEDAAEIVSKKMIYTPLDPTKLGFSMNGLLKQPYLFITDNLLRDVDALTKAYEGQSIDRLLVDAKVKWMIGQQIAAGRNVPLKSSTLKIDSHLKVRAKMFEESLVLLQKKNKILPLKNSQLQELVWIDVRRNKKDHLKLNNVVQFHQYNARWLTQIPNEKYATAVLAVIPRFVVLVDNQDDLPEVLIKIHRFKNLNPSLSINLVLLNNQLNKRFVSNDYSSFDFVVLGYENQTYLWECAVQGVCGGFGFSAHSLFDLPGLCKAGEGETVPALRLQIGIPEEAGMSALKLSKIDSLVYDAIDAEAIPGAQLVIARNGVVVYRKEFGTTSYQKGDSVRASNLYDIASVTKIMSSTPLLMHLYNEGRLDLNKSIGEYLPELKNSNKADIKVYELLTHKAGLRANVPTFLDAIDRKALSGNLYSKIRSATHPLQIEDRLFLNSGTRLREDLFGSSTDTLFSIEVAEGLYMNHHYLDSIWSIIETSPLDKLKAYKYSDMGLVILQRILERIENKPLDVLCDSLLFQPMGVGGMSYCPRKRYALDKIVPTENDKVFRKQLLTGYVHDPGAAMMGGIAGHAGLFSTADDVTKMMQMYLNNGVYGDVTFYKPETVERFVSRYNLSTRRGLGFDKPEADPLKIGPVCSNASLLSFGHLGFTGTIAWADPQRGLVFVMLANRVHPNGWNRKFISTNVRNKAMTMAYEAIIE